MENLTSFPIITGSTALAITVAYFLLRQKRPKVNDSLDALKTILRDNGNYHIEFKGFLDNHLSQGAIALYRLGASPERMMEYEKWYTKKLEKPREVTVQITQKNWKDYLGKRENFIAYKFFFREELKRENNDWKQLINKFWPILLDAMPASATHPSIHLGWAIDVAKDCLEESIIMQIEGLSHLCYSAFVSVSSPELTRKRIGLSNSSSSHSPIIKSDEKEGKTLWEGLNEIISIFDEKARKTLEEKANSPMYKKLGLGLFQSKLLIILNEYHDVLERIYLSTSLGQYLRYGEEKSIKGKKDWNAILEEITTTITILYICSLNDFFILHGVTLWHGLVNILGVLTDEKVKRKTLESYILSVLTIFIVQNFPGKDTKTLKRILKDNNWKGAATDLIDYYKDELESKASWQQIKEVACSSKTDDEHNMKLPYAVYRFSTETTSPQLKKLLQIAGGLNALLLSDSEPELHRSSKISDAMYK